MTSVEPLPRAFAHADWRGVGLRDASPVSSSCTLVKVWRRSLLHGLVGLLIYLYQWRREAGARALAGKGGRIGPK